MAYDRTAPLPSQQKRPRKSAQFSRWGRWEGWRSCREWAAPPMPTRHERRDVRPGQASGAALSDRRAAATRHVGHEACGAVANPRRAGADFDSRPRNSDQRAVSKAGPADGQGPRRAQRLARRCDPHFGRLHDAHRGDSSQGQLRQRQHGPPVTGRPAAARLVGGQGPHAPAAGCRSCRCRR